MRDKLKQTLGMRCFALCARESAENRHFRAEPARK